MKRATTLLKRRAVSAIPVLLIVLVFTFVLLENASGDAVDAYLVSIGGGDAGLQDVLREQYGLNGSVLARFWLYARLGAAARFRLVACLRPACAGADP